MTITLIDGLWTDGNGNTARDGATEQESVVQLSSLTNCYDCTDCWGCTDSRDCINCGLCVGCTDCEWCSDCTSCYDDCWLCNDCHGCKEVEKSTAMTDCEDCMFCFDCYDCTRTKHSRHANGLVCGWKDCGKSEKGDCDYCESRGSACALDPIGSVSADTCATFDMTSTVQTKIEFLDGLWTDARGNTAKKGSTEEEAREQFSTLSCCWNCTDCWNCKGCCGCTNCVDCAGVDSYKDLQNIDFYELSTLAETS